ncbi:MAG: lptC, partial [Gammaproteobacteria bacterium]|nr:lptC [Gammaproteobacteria bacterium]
SVIADKGWLTAGNEVVLLAGNVQFTEQDAAGAIVLQINTEKARLLLNQNYAETDDYARIRTRRTSITGTGMQVNFAEGKLKVLNDVRTTISAN